MNIEFHYPPELLELLVDTIPRLVKSKKSTVLFFKGAGVQGKFLDEVSLLVVNSPDEINKYEIARRILIGLNQRGESGLRERREVLRRVVEFEDFTTCWENDRLKAQGLVSQIRKIVKVKDSFTRLNEERESERRAHQRKQDEALRIRQDFDSRIESLRHDLFALFPETNRQSRGKKLEGVLNRLFEAYGILVRSDFQLRGERREGTVEQVDGVIELEGRLCFVEMKWWAVPIGVPEISEHLVRVFGRAETSALIISASEYTAPAIATCRDALRDRVVTLCTLQEIVLILEKRSNLLNFLKRKMQSTVIDKNPFPQFAIE